MKLMKFFNYKKDHFFKKMTMVFNFRASSIRISIEVQLIGVTCDKDREN